MPIKNVEAAILPQNVPAPNSESQSTTINALKPLLAATQNFLTDNTHYGQSFPIKAPTAFTDLIHPNNLNDPLLQQILPVAAEQHSPPEYQLDPTEDLNQQPIPGLLHKYHGRVLLIMTGACAIHCRYCFRRHYPYQDQQIKPSHWLQILAYLKQDSSIEEVILSGGDPLTLNDRKLLPLLQDLQAIEHINTIRFHTRLLSFSPERLTPEFTDWLKHSNKSIVVIYHINHAQELPPSLQTTSNTLQQLGVTQLNQSVLLKSINDNLETLEALSRGLFKLQILPYYLHQLDLVQGAAHFKVEDDLAKSLHLTLQKRLPGYLVPKLVYELPNNGSKQWL